MCLKSPVHFVVDEDVGRLLELVRVVEPEPEGAEGLLQEVRALLVVAAEHVAHDVGPGNRNG